TLARANEERHAVPAPRIDVQLHRGKGLHTGIGRDTRLIAVPLELAADETVSAQRTHRAEDLHLLVAHRFTVAADRRFHREEADDLQQVVLNDVANCAGFLVEPPAAGHAEPLGHRDL